MITATPVNNGPADLLSLLRLFAADDWFRDIGVPSLRDAFEEAGDEALTRVSAVVRSVVIRRTRALVHDRFDALVPGALAPSSAAIAQPRFPLRSPPHVIHYRDPDLPRVVGLLARLELAPYDLDAEGGRSAGGALIRLNLLKRLDSSTAAFAVSLARLDRLLRDSLDAARSGRVLGLGSRGGGPGGDADPLQLTLLELVTERARPDVDLRALIASLERDTERVSTLTRSIRRISGADQKEGALRTLLESLQGEKVVVFTEYRDTAEALWRALSGSFRVGRVDGSGAWLGRRSAGRRLVVERFAPRANGRRPPRDVERVDLLIATDVLAEGVNLQDARHIVSYDLPWNPVRLLQRIGRVDRLGSPHGSIVPHLFIPAEGLDEMLGLTRHVRRKLGHIAATVGTEQGEALLQRLGEGQAQAAASALINQALDAADGSRDPLEALRTMWVRSRAAEPARSLEPVRALVPVPADDPAAALAWIVLVEWSGSPRLLEVSRNGTVAEPGSRSISALTAALTGAHPARPIAPTCPIPRGAIRAHLQRSRHSACAPARISPRDPGHRLARRIRASIRHAGAAVDPADLRRADTLLSRLAVPLGPAAAARTRVLDRAEDADLRQILSAIEAALGPSVAPRATPPGEGDESAIVAALKVCPDHPPRPVDAPPGRG